MFSSVFHRFHPFSIGFFISSLLFIYKVLQGFYMFFMELYNPYPLAGGGPPKM